MHLQSFPKGLHQFVLLFAILWASTAAHSMPQTDLERVLDQLDSPSFVMAITGFASDAPTATLIALRKPEIQFLISNQETSIPEMCKRLSRPHGLRYESTKIVYFMVFARTKDPCVIPLIADYLDSTPDSDEKRANDFDTDPFQYAANAATDLLDRESLRILTQKYERQIRTNAISPFSIRHELAASLRSAYKLPSSQNK